MAWSVTGSPGLFRREAGAFVSARPDRHTMLLSALDSLERAPARRRRDGRPPGLVA